MAGRFAREGADVVPPCAWCRAPSVVADALGPSAVEIRTRCRGPPTSCAAFDEIEARFSRHDILVNNGAVDRPCTVDQLSDFDIDRQVRTNFLGSVHTCRAAIPLRRSAGGGDIVTTSSESTLDPFPFIDRRLVQSLPN